MRVSRLGCPAATRGRVEAPYTLTPSWVSGMEGWGWERRTRLALPVSWG